MDKLDKKLEPRRKNEPSLARSPPPFLGEGLGEGAELCARIPKPPPLHPSPESGGGGLRASEYVTFPQLCSCRLSKERYLPV